MRMRLHHWIFLAMGAGVAVGLALSEVDDKSGAGYTTILDALNFVGRTLFIGALKMIIAPLILFSIVAGVTSIPTFGEAGRIGTKTLAYYIATTTVAVAIGLVLVLTIRPGLKPSAERLRADRTAELQERAQEFQEETGKDPKLEANRAPYQIWLQDREGADQSEKYKRVTAKRDRGTFEMFVEDIVQPLLMNPFQSLAERNSLGIIFWSLFMALAMMAVGAPARPLIELFRAGNEVILKMTHWLMSITPFAIFCLMAGIVATHGAEVFEALGWYVATVIAGIAVHIGFLLTVVTTLGRTNPMVFLRGIREAWAVAFATRSSAATLPVTVRCVTNNLGVSKRVANFTLPVGATVNMDGTALCEGVAVIFLLQIYGGMDDVSITLTAGVTLVVFITAVLASVGAAAVPDAGLVTMVLVASAVHLPVYYIPLIFAVDAFLDMFRTSTNVLGDAVGAMVVDRLEGEAGPPDPSEDALEEPETAVPPPLA